MLRRQAAFLLLLASAVAFGVLATWALAPVQEDSSSSSLSSRWNSVKVSLAGRGDPLDGLDKKKRRKQESCPRGVQLDADVECPPHKRETHYEKYSIREYYGGTLFEERKRGSERARARGKRLRQRQERKGNVIVDKASRHRKEGK